MSLPKRNRPEEFIITELAMTLSFGDLDWNVLQNSQIEFMERIHSTFGFYPEDTEIILINVEGGYKRFFFSRKTKNENFKKELSEWKEYQKKYEVEMRAEKLKRQEKVAAKINKKEIKMIENISGIINSNLSFSEKKTKYFKSSQM